MVECGFRDSGRWVSLSEMLYAESNLSDAADVSTEGQSSTLNGPYAHSRKNTVGAETSVHLSGDSRGWSTLDTLNFASTPCTNTIEAASCHAFS